MATVKRPLPVRKPLPVNSEPKPAVAKEPVKAPAKRPSVVKPKADVARLDDGTPMPMAELPTMDLTNIEQRMLDDMKILSSDDKLPAMGMIYGDVGTGKTTAAFEIMQGIINPGDKILYVDSAAGWTTLMNYPHLMRDSEGVPNVIRMEYHNIETLQALAKAIKVGKGEFGKIVGVIFDEYTQMHDADLNWITDVRANQAENEGVFKDRFTPTWPEYNSARTRSNRTLALFMLSGAHLIFVGHSKVTKKLETVPDMPEKAGKSLYARLHFAYLMKFDAAGKVIMQTHGAKREMAKNRINGIASQSNAKEFIERYKVWGKEDKVIASKPEPIATEEIPEMELPEVEPDDDLTAMLN